MKRGLAVVGVLLVALGAAVGVSTALQDDGDDGGMNDSKIENIDQFDPYRYAEVWEGDPSLPDRPMSLIGLDEWARIVRRYEDAGFGGLEEADRVLLLQGSVKAYLSMVRSTERVIEADGGGRAEVTEAYERGGDGTHIALNWYDSRSKGIVAAFGDIAYTEAGEHHEKLLILGPELGLGPDPVIVHWQLGVNGEWSCTVNETDGAELAFASSFHYQVLLSPLVGEFVREENVGGRRGLMFEVGHPDAKQRVWLDQETLLPVKHEYPPWNSPGAPPEAEFPARTVRVTGYNVIDEELQLTGCDDGPPER